MRFAGAIVLVLGLWVGAVSPALAQSPLDETVNGATKYCARSWPFLKNASPNRCCASARRRDRAGNGKGRLHRRCAARQGSAYNARRNRTLAGAGFHHRNGRQRRRQAGVQAIDLILVFKTKRSVQGILKGKITIGADLAVAAGPVGRQALAATDAQLKAEILSYSRSRGLFAGVAIDGATMHIDHGANAEYYALRPGQPAGSIPVSGVALAQLVSRYVAPPPRQAPVVVLTPAEAAPPPTFAPPDEREAVRQQLVAVAQRLQSALDPTWQQYLALPTEVITGQPLPPGATLEPVVRRYQTVASEARYHELSEHHEFQETYALLRRYASLAQPHPAGTLPLPPPPGR